MDCINKPSRDHVGRVSVCQDHLSTGSLLRFRNLCVTLSLIWPLIFKRMRESLRCQCWLSALSANTHHDSPWPNLHCRQHGTGIMADACQVLFGSSDEYEYEYEQSQLQLRHPQLCCINLRINPCLPELTLGINLKAVPIGLYTNQVSFRCQPREFQARHFWQVLRETTSVSFQYQSRSFAGLGRGLIGFRYLRFSLYAFSNEFNLLRNLLCLHDEHLMPYSPLYVGSVSTTTILFQVIG